MLKKEVEESKEKYPWLDKSDDRKYMTDREILDKYIDLDKLCLIRGEKEDVRELLYEYKDAFNLRDEIGTCPNIEVEIDIMDKSPFFLRPISHKGGRTKYFGQGNEEVMLLPEFLRKVFQLTPAQ